MDKRLFGVGIMASAGVLNAQDSAVELRTELRDLQSDYESRIALLEAKIRELEASESGNSNPRKIAAARNQTVEAPHPADKPDLPGAITRGNTEVRDIARESDFNKRLEQRVGDVLEDFVEINGYFRAGYGRSDKGGPMRAFGAPGVAKYRLGNETENYGELVFSKTFYTPGYFSDATANATDPVASFVYRLSFVNPYDDYGSSADTDFGSPEIWGALENVIPGLPEARFWAGERFYRRHDIHINDFYFWDMSGGGGGLEEIPLGPGSFAVAWIGNGRESGIYERNLIADPLNVAGFSKSTIDFRYYDWDFLGGKGEVGLAVSLADSGVDANGLRAEDSEGVALVLVKTDEDFLDDESLHRASLQIGTGPAKTFTSGFETFTNSIGTFIRPDPNESWRFRATDQVIVKPWEQLGLGSALVYQYTDFGDNTDPQQWASGGIRPIWFFNDAVNLAFEAGVDWLSDSSLGSGGTIGKLTLAPQVALGEGFFSRPVLRAFVTYALWGGGLQGSIGGPDYAGEENGWSWGLQMESWW